MLFRELSYRGPFFQGPFFCILKRESFFGNFRTGDHPKVSLIIIKEEDTFTVSGKNGRGKKMANGKNGRAKKGRKKMSEQKKVGKKGRGRNGRRIKSDDSDQSGSKIKFSKRKKNFSQKC